MFMHNTDFDKHLDMMEEKDIDAYMFKLSKSEIIQHQSNHFFKNVAKIIINGVKEHSLIIIEETHKGWETYLIKKAKSLGKQVDGKRNHQISFFILPSELFTSMVSEVTDGWENWRNTNERTTRNS